MKQVYRYSVSYNRLDIYPVEEEGFIGSGKHKWYRFKGWTEKRPASRFHESAEAAIEAVIETLEKQMVRATGALADLRQGNYERKAARRYNPEAIYFKEED